MFGQIIEQGYAIIDDVLSPAQIEHFIFVLEQLSVQQSVRMRGGIFAVRNLLEVSSDVADLAASSQIRDLVTPVLGQDAFPVRGILFDKIPNANWKVPWHQDVTIAVRERIEMNDFGPWSTKAGVLHVQPPARVLENMLSVRLHLDDCQEANGALKVIPGTHLQGRISEQSLDAIRGVQPTQTCAVRAGGALLMRPLLLHASSSSEIPNHRRVIHIDYAATHLPNGLKWLSEPVQSQN